MNGHTLHPIGEPARRAGSTVKPVRPGASFDGADAAPVFAGIAPSMTPELPDPAMTGRPWPPVTLRAAAAPTAPALVLRPWCDEDVPALVEAYRDPRLRRWASFPVESEDDGLRWVREQEQGWARGDRFAFAVLEAVHAGAPAPPAGNVVLKEVAPGKPAGEVGYWTAARARGRGVAPRALEALTAWAFGTFAADGLEHLELLHQVDNLASCRVAGKGGYALDRILPSAPPLYPRDGHLHIRYADA